MENLPSDPMMLYSYLNTLLRDRFKSLDDLCYDLDIDKAEIEKKMHLIGMQYDPIVNQFR